MMFFMFVMQLYFCATFREKMSRLCPDFTVSKLQRWGSAPAAGSRNGFSFKTGNFTLLFQIVPCLQKLGSWLFLS